MNVRVEPKRTLSAKELMLSNCGAGEDSSRRLFKTGQHHSSKTSVLRHSAFFMVQLSHSYMTTGKTIALTRQTFVSKVMSLLFNTLYRFVIAFLSRRSLTFNDGQMLFWKNSG